MSELFDEIMAKKEQKEKAKTIEVQMDPNDPSSWTEEMIADYFVWIMKKKGSNFVESTMGIIIEKLKSLEF